MRTCLKHVDHFVRLRRFENFSLKEAMHGMKSRHFPPCPAAKEGLGASRPRKRPRENPNRLRCATRFHRCPAPRLTRSVARAIPTGVFALCSQRQQLLSSWIFWVFTYLVVPLIRTGFYATECEG